MNTPIITEEIQIIKKYCLKKDVNGSANYKEVYRGSIQ